MRQIRYPENFDGAVFSSKFGVDFTRFIIDGDLLRYDETATGVELTEADLADCVTDLVKVQRVRDRKANSASNAKRIPNWALWDEAQAAQWFEDNLSDAIIDSVSNLDEAKVILKRYAAVLRGLARMSIAIRDHIWPDLPEE